MFLKCISFDLEILPLNEQMPTPDKCPILLASCHFNYDYEVNDYSESTEYVGCDHIECVKTRNIVFLLTKNFQNIEVQKKDNAVIRIIYYLKDEVKLIERLFNLIRRNDVIIGYNISGFDFPYLIDRAKTLKIKNLNIGLADKNVYYRKHLSKGFTVTKIGGVTGKIIFDVLSLMKREDASNVFKKKYNLKVTALRHVSKEILEIEKLDFDVREIIKYWNNTDDIELRNKFIDYCSRDSELPLMFLCKFRLLDKFITLSNASGRVVQEVINSLGSGIMVENLLLKEFKKYDRVMPIRIHKELEYSIIERELEGAEVAEPKLGVSENLCSVDYKSLYPSLMIKYNLCYSTLVLEHDISKIGLTESDIETQYDEMGSPYAKFVRKEKYVGIVPKKLTELLMLRATQKKELKKYEKGTPMYYLWDASQEATKILLNSFYGYSGDSDAKIYSWFIASAVTTTGRKQIKGTWMIITEEIGRVCIGERWFKLVIVQGDTDSSYMQVIALDDKEISRDEAIKVVNMILDNVNSRLEKPMQLDFENYIRRIIITAKKRYAYLSIDENGKEVITSKGIETIRRDWCNYSTDNMSKVIDFVLKEKNVEDGVRKSIELIREQVKMLNEDKVNLYSLVLSKKLTKSITSYDMKAVHVQVAIKMKERGHAPEVGDRIQYIITDNGKKLISEKAEEADYVINNINKFEIDKDFYVHHQLLPPTMRVLELLGVNEKTITNSIDVKHGKQKGLFEF